jgi:hypothetical protein
MAGASMMQALLDLIDNLAKVESDMGKLAGIDIEQGTDAAQDSAAFTLQSGKDQAHATKMDAYASLGSAIGNFVGLGGMAIGSGIGAYKTRARGLDTKISANDNAVKAIEKLPKPTENTVMSRGEIGVDDGPVTTVDELRAAYTAKGKAHIADNAEKLKDPSYGTRESSIPTLNSDETAEATAYIQKCEKLQDPGEFKGALESIKKRSMKSNKALHEEKQSINATVQKFDQVSQLVSQMIGSSLNATASMFKSDAQIDQSQAEAAKALASAIQQIIGTAQSQVVSSRDSKQQQIDQILQTITAAINANRAGG